MINFGSIKLTQKEAGVIPTLDSALCTELGRRVVIELMTRKDWENALDRIASWKDEDIPFWLTTAQMNGD